MANTSKISGVYRIRNKVTGDTYIGASQSIFGRWSTHRSDFNAGIHTCKLQAAYDEHGLAAFEIEILLICAVVDLDFFEARALQVLKPTYNTQPTLRIRARKGCGQ